MSWEGSYELFDAMRCESIATLQRTDPGCESCAHSVCCPSCGEAVYCAIHGEINDVFCNYEDWTEK